MTALSMSCSSTAFGGGSICARAGGTIATFVMKFLVL